MFRYFFQIAYKGSHYRGWQRQPNVRSIQQTIENRLAEALRKESMTIIGCGRTDAGVHASNYFFHTDLDEKLSIDLKFILNKRLPKDIAVLSIRLVDQSRHARFGATQRTYNYFLHTQKDPFLAELSSYCSFENALDFSKMTAAIELIKSQEDFFAFCKSPDKHNTTICHIFDIRFYVDQSGQKLRFEITANRFLRGMIRILVKKILEIGESYTSLEEIKDCFEKHQRPAKIKSAPAEGLYLSKIEYPFLEESIPSIFPIFDINWIEIK